MNKMGSYIGFGILLVVVLLAGYGYVMNIIELIGLETFILSGKVIVAVVGIFIPPLGVIMGLFVW